MFPPPKKHGLDVMIAVGKPKNGPPDLRGPEEPDEEDQQDDGADEEQEGDAPDEEESAGDIGRYAAELSAIPSVAKPLGEFLKAMCEHMKDSGGYQADEETYSPAAAMR